MSVVTSKLLGEITPIIEQQVRDVYYLEHRFHLDLLKKVDEVKKSLYVHSLTIPFVVRTDHKIILIIPWVGPAKRDPHLIHGVDFDDGKIETIAKNFLIDMFCIQEEMNLSPSPDFRCPIAPVMQTLCKKLKERFDATLSWIEANAKRCEATAPHMISRKLEPLGFDLLLMPANQKVICTKVPIANGATRKVSLAISIPDGEMLCLLRAKKNNPVKLEDFQKESQTIEKYQNGPCIIKTLVNIFFKERHLMLQPLCQQGDLQIYYTRKAISLPNVLQIMLDSARAVEYFHLNRAVHCDIKMENILIHEKENLARAFLTDLTFVTKVFDINGEKMRGTVLMLSPEIFETIGTINPATIPFVAPHRDVWALGMIFYIIYYKKFPKWVDIILKYKCSITSDMLHELEKIFSSKNFFNKPDSNDLIAHLIWEMLQVEPYNRVSISRVVTRLKEIAKTLNLKIVL